jgi:1-acyl-sn-glycerol-3-phosphate acyltransferase
MLYTIVRGIIGWWARWYLRLEVIGREHVPPAGGLLVACNHVSYLDIPMLACALGRRADFMGKLELFRVPVIGWIYRQLGGFPVRRGGVTKEALHEAARRLRAGRVVVIYPEGQINETGGPLPPKPGLGVIVARSGVPVLPVYVSGTDAAMPRGQWWIRPRPVKVLIGRPLVFDRPEWRDELYEPDPEEASPMRDRQRAWYLDVGQRVMQEISTLRIQGLQNPVAEANTDRGVSRS